MSETRTQTRARQRQYYSKNKSSEGGTPLKRFVRRLLANPQLKVKGRGLLQMKLLSSNQAFTMGVAEQAKQLKTSRWNVNALRRLAVETGLWTEAEDVYKRAGEQWEERFKACKAIDLGVRFISVLMAMHKESSDDGWVHQSERQLAKQLGAKPDSISNLTGWLENLTDDDGHKLFEVRREAGRRNAYRPMLKEASEQKTTQRQSRQSSAATVDEVVAGLFNGSKILARAFKSDILVKAVKLHLGNAGAAELAAALGALYGKIKEARGDAKAARGGMPAPLDLLEQYVNWLADQDWLGVATVKVLQFDSPSFVQWRRNMAMHYGYDCDPVTGKSRWRY